MFSSVNTNMGAMVALQSLNRTNSEMATTQKAISTGLRVADAKDDGAAFAVAERVRSNVGALTSANQQLRGVKGTVDSTLGALKEVSSVMKDMKEVLIKLASSDVQGESRVNYKQAYNDKLTSIKNFIADASKNSNGGALITAEAAASQPANYGNISVVRNEAGENMSITAVSLEAEIVGITYSDADLNSATAVQGHLASGASYDDAFDKIGREANAFGTKAKYIDNQLSYNETKIDAMKGGLGALIDADLTKEAANLQALQVRQQLGTQSLSMANQASQSLLSLFR